MSTSDKSPSRNQNDALLQFALGELERVKRNARHPKEQIVWLPPLVIDEVVALIRYSIAHCRAQSGAMPEGAAHG